MSDILICEQNFTMSEALSDLLSRRRIAVMPSKDAATTKGAIYVLSAEYEAKASNRKVLDEARGFGARTVFIVDEKATAVSIETEMGGRLVRFGLPTSQVNVAPTRNEALLRLADALGSHMGSMVAADKSTGQLMDMAKRVARSDVTVFVNGPTGSGKEVLARMIHENSPRAAQPFIAINCAAIPENMLEAILFGHEKGSFTGASAANRGIIRAADGGTLLLDEVSEMPMGLQAKLLRVLQERKVTPLGSQKEEDVNIRVIATSNRDMLDEVRRGNFREDLYYRLNVFPLSTQALANRPDDIPALAVAMIRRHTPTVLPMPTLTQDAIDTLLAHDWPGNVRELENVIQRALVLCQDDHITPADIMLNPQEMNKAA